MTKEENIATLNEHLTHWKRLLSEKICDQDEGENTIYALQNAIKALEQQPTDAVDRVTIKEYLESFKDTNEKEPCEDCVSRRAVYEILNDAYFLKIDDGAALQESVRQLPSVTPQPKTGRLILLDECSNSGYYCSECQKKVVKEGWSNTVKKIKYCPNCGANMSEIPTGAEGSEE